MTVWKNRIVGYGEESPDQLLANPLNFRIHPRFQQEALSGVMNELGVVQNVIVNRTTGYILDGHLRVTMAMREDQPTVPVTYVEVSEDEEKKVLAVLDQLTGLAGRDDELLRELLDGMESEHEAVQTLLDDLLAETTADTGDGESDEDYDPGNPVIQYNLIFDTEGQQEKWYDFIKWLRDRYPDAETLGERIEQYVSEGDYATG